MTTMAYDTGPDKLAELDRKLAEGELTQHEHEVQRVQLLERIRKGQTIATTTGDRLGQAGLIILGVLGWFTLAAIIVNLGGPPGVAWILGTAFLVACIIFARKLGRPNVSAGRAAPPTPESQNLPS